MRNYTQCLPTITKTNPVHLESPKPLLPVSLSPRDSQSHSKPCLLDTQPPLKSPPSWESLHFWRPSRRALWRVSFWEALDSRKPMSCSVMPASANVISLTPTSSNAPRVSLTWVCAVDGSSRLGRGHASLVSIAQERPYFIECQSGESAVGPPLCWY